MKLKAILSLLMSLLISAPAAETSAKTEEAVFGGGCFWCTEGCYQIVPGVVKVTSGYSGGTVENPTYEQVCTKTTGHAEVVKIEFDPAKVSYRDLVDLFWFVHDPTTYHRQGADEGPQYRSIILYANEAQKKAAEESMKAAQKELPAPITTEIVPLKAFYSAEKYHQNFANNNPYQGYVCAVVKPKVEKFKHKLAEIEKKAAGK